MNWLYYLAEANLYLGVFYLAYCAFLSRETHYQLNRTYLLFSCIAAFALPVLKVGSLRSVTKPMEVPVTYVVPMQTQATIAAPGYAAQSLALPNNIRPSTAVITAQSREVKSNMSMADYLWYAYLAGVVISLVILMVRLTSLFLLARHASRDKQENYKVVMLPGTNAAFSFFGYLFLGDNAPATDTIIAHELVHIRQKHSADIIFLELIKVINWFNPCIYLLQNSLKTIHEYIADEQTALLKADTLSYATFLVNTAHGVSGSPITHSFFNYSLLKKRIIMLNQKRSGNSARLKYLLTAPICAGLLCVSTLAFTKSYSWIDLDPVKHSDAKIKDAKSVQKNHVHKNMAIDDATVVLSETTDNGDIALSGDKFEPENVITNIKQPDEDRPMIPIEAAGGYEQLNRYLLKNINYKPAKGDKGGLVVMSFTVGVDRKITDLKVATSDGQVMDNLALNAFKNYTGIVNDDEGKTLKIGVFFFTDDYSIFKRPFENDPGNSGWVTVTKYGFMPPRTSKGYEFNQIFGARYSDNRKVTRNVRISEKNDEQIWYNADTATPAELKLLKDKYGYVFPSNTYTAIEAPKPKNGKIYMAYSLEVSSYLNDPYTTIFWDRIQNDLIYPEKEKREGTPGAVLLKFNLDQNGIISDVGVAKTGGDAFDQSALDAVRSFTGTINDKAGPHTIAVVFCTAQNGKRPKVDESWKKITGYVGEIARGENRPIYAIFSVPKKS